MFAQIRRADYTIQLGPDNGNENANMMHFSSAGYQSKPFEIYSDTANYLSSNNVANLPMTIRPQFFQLPVSSMAGQSQVETFLHELSHFAAGTIDYNPPACYDIVGANFCISQGITVAVRNAENVGFFIHSYC